MLELEFEDKNHQVEKRRGHSRNRKNIYAGMLVGNRSILLLILCVNERQKAKWCSLKTETEQIKKWSERLLSIKKTGD